MDYAQSVVAHKSDDQKSDVSGADAPLGTASYGRHYAEMTRARLAFMQAHQRWLLHGNPSAEDAETETRGTAYVLRHWNDLLLGKVTTNGR